MGFQLKAEVPDRECTRCKGKQHLLGFDVTRGFGVYVCDTCALRIGYDKRAEFPEFIIDKGKTYCYTKEKFGERLNSDERRVAQDASESDSSEWLEASEKALSEGTAV